MGAKKLITLEAVKQEARRFLDQRGLSLGDGDYVPVTAAKIAELGGRGLPEIRCAGLLINYHDVKGAPIDFLRFRALEQPRASGWARLTGRERDELRYLQPGGTDPRVYFPKNFKFTPFFQKPVRERGPLHITEGEFKADALAKRGIPAIGLGGVHNYLAKGKDGTSQLLPELVKIPWPGMRVRLCYDSDAATNAYVIQARDGLCELLEARGAILEWIPLPQLTRGEKTGVDDYLHHKEGGLKKFLALPVERWYGPNVPHLQARAKDDFLAHKYETRESILVSPAGVFLRHPSIVQIHAWRGVGKTQLALYQAGALAGVGGQFFNWRSTRPMRVLYVEGEQPAVDVQKVVELQTASAKAANLHMMTLEDQPLFRFPKIVTPEGQAAWERYIEEHKIEVLFLDSLSTLASIPMNDEEAQLKLTDWFMRLRTGLRVTVVYLQHDGKTGQQRGHSKHEDLIDLSIHLTWPADYQGVQGLRANFHIDKARQPIPDGQAMRISFGNDLKDPCKLSWTWGPLSRAEEKDEVLLNAALAILALKRDTSARVLEEKLKEKGFKGKHVKFRELHKKALDLLEKERGK